MPPRPFARGAFADSRLMTILKWIILPPVVVHVTLATWAGFRAIVQVFSLDLRVPSPVLQGGSTIGYKVVSSGRVVRATAIGSPQWLRTPPPTVREIPVTIASPFPAK